MSYAMMQSPGVRMSRVAMSGLRGFGGFGAINPNANTYTMESGDYGTKIAQKLGCPSVQVLINANPGKNWQKMPAGTVLTIPQSCSAWVDYEAKARAEAQAAAAAAAAQQQGGEPVYGGDPLSRPPGYVPPREVTPMDPGAGAAGAGASGGFLSTTVGKVAVVGGAVVVLGIIAMVALKDDGRPQAA